MNNVPTLVFTGGHHTSALEVAKTLRVRGWNIVWLGHKFSMWGDTSPSAEFNEVTASGIKFIDLKAGKMYHTFNPLKLIRVPFGFLQSYSILRSLKKSYPVKGIITFGGYLGVPVVFSGWLLGLPTISHEQTTVTGWANKFISLFAGKVAVTWPESLSLYPSAKAVMIGLPLRSEILSEIKKPVKRQKLVYITGGKQGSHIINLAVFAILKKLLEEYSVVHQTGSSTIYNDYESALKKRSLLPPDLKEKYTVFKYVDAQTAAKNIVTAGVVVGRSGAHITYELAVSGTPAVLIPIPWTSHDEQNMNALVLQNKHQAVILPQHKLTGESLLEAIKTAVDLKADKSNLPLNATQVFVQLIESQFQSPS